jgi:hypothetical protein
MPKISITTYLKLMACLTVACCLLTSCATLFNRPNQNVRVYTTKPSMLVYHADTIKTNNNQAFLYAKRQKAPLEFIVVTDTGAKKVIVKSTLSFGYYSNIFFYAGFPGLLIDLASIKRYGYPIIQLDQKNAIVRRRPFDNYVTKSKKGDFLLNVSIPLANGFHVNPDGEPMRYIQGGLGISAGLDYFHDDKQFLNLSATAAIDGPHFEKRGQHEEARTRYLSFSNNHVIGRFSVGYGLAYTHNTWEYVNYEGIAYFGEWRVRSSEGRIPITKSNNALGLVFTSYFKIAAGLNAGVIYRPTYIRFGSDNKYEHLLSFDVAYKIPINEQLFKRPAKRMRPHPKQR